MGMDRSQKWWKGKSGCLGVEADGLRWRMERKRGWMGGLVIPYVFLEAIRLRDQCPFKDDPPLLVPLVLLCGKLIDPAKFGIAVLTGHVTDHVSSCQHYPVLYLTVSQIDHPLEEESTPGGPSEARGDELSPVSENGIAGGTGE